MAEDFVELGATGIDHVVDKYWDKGYDRVRQFKGGQKTKDEKRKYRNELPSPERERAAAAGAAAGGGAAAAQDREDSLERESRTTESVKNAYENERDDPTRRVDPRLERKYRRDSARMSQYNGYAADGRARSAQPPSRGRYDDYDDDSDYDERSGRRYKTSGRGYDDRDDRDDRDYPYDREVVETERYRGPAGQYQPRRMDSYGSRADPYGPGAVAQYRRSQNDLTEVSRRSRSRGRRDRYRDDDDDYDDRDRSGSRGKDHEGWRGKLDEHFDTSMQGLGVGLAGAVVGGLAGREFGGRGPHKQRDVLLGALIGGLGANVAENKWRDWREEKKEKLERKEERWEEKWDGRDYGRSRSNVR